MEPKGFCQKNLILRRKRNLEFVVGSREQLLKLWFNYDYLDTTIAQFQKVFAVKK